MNSYGVRCVIQIAPEDLNKKKFVYEERITIWRANDIDEAVDKAECEVKRYCEMETKHRFTGLSQAFWMFDEIEANGVEVFSLLRESNLEQDDYLNRFFSTEDERQQTNSE